MTSYTCYTVFKRRAFKNIAYGVLRVFIDFSILFFLTLGMYCQFTYGKIDPQQYLSKFNLSWIGVQKTCIYLIISCCGVMLLTVAVQLFYTMKLLIDKRRKLKKNTEQVQHQSESREPSSLRPVQDPIADTLENSNATHNNYESKRPSQALKEPYRPNLGSKKMKKKKKKQSIRIERVTFGLGLESAKLNSGL